MKTTSKPGKILRTPLSAAKAKGVQGNEINELKQKFLSVTAHDFRTPLNTITLATELLESHYDSLSRQDIFSQLTAIKTAATYMNTIINDFLAVEKIEQHKDEPEVAGFDLKDFTQSVIAVMKQQTKHWQDIKYQHAGASSQVALNKNMLQHCLTNLISNAIKYSDVADHIEVGTEIVGDMCMIWVKDYGIGIPDKEKKNLFEPFFRASNASGIEGTGLGLNIVKRYTELMGGSVEVKSDKKKGTIFTLVFPLTPWHRKHSDKDHAKH